MSTISPSPWAVDGLSLVPSTDPILRRKVRPVTDLAEVSPLIGKMQKLREQQGGLGLAAPQVGIDLAFFVTCYEDFRVAINPSYEPGIDPGRTSAAEGCLSFPGRTTYVSRHDEIRATWTTPTGGTYVTFLTGYPARVFQHETDHLNGICIFP